MKTGKNRTISSKKDLMFYVCLMVWPTLQFIVFYIFVNFNTIILAFKPNANLIQEMGEVKLAISNLIDNVKLFFSSVGSSGMSTAFRISLLSWVVTTGTTVPLGLLFSFYIAKKLPASGIFRVILFLPAIIPGIVLVAMYKYFMNQALPMILQDFFGRVVDGAILDNSKASSFIYILLYRIWISFGTSVLMYSISMSEISPDIVEASQIDGANSFQEFVHVSFPGVYTTLVTFLVTSVAGILTDQSEIFSFYGWQSGQISSIGYLLFLKTTAATGNSIEYPPIAAFGLLLTAVAVPVTFLVKHLLEKFGPRED